MIDTLPSDHEFNDDLASLVEEYEEKTELSRVELLGAVEEFADEWMTTKYITGETW